jgi:2-methylisocitrate lyase-like PEP mutase family enzyme
MTIKSRDGANGDVQELLAATKLRRMLEDPNKLVFLPGVYDGFSARVALQVGGWDGLYMVLPTC